MRLIVARCEVRYSGRLNALLPEALRLIMVKADGSVLVHADAGGYKPLNCPATPTVRDEAARAMPRHQVLAAGPRQRRGPVVGRRASPQASQAQAGR